MAIVLSAKSKVITGGAVGVACLLSGLMFCNLFGWNDDGGGGGGTAASSTAGGPAANRQPTADDRFKKAWYPKSLHLYQKDRLNGLALMSIHRDIPIDVDAIIDEMAITPRKLDFDL